MNQPALGRRAAAWAAGREESAGEAAGDCGRVRNALQARTMHGSELAELATFVAVARLRSFSKAAVERSVASSAVSHAIRSLEERVGVRLFHRTTRSVSLTDAGERFLAELQPAFGQIGKALDTLNDFRGTPFGTLRLNVPASIGTFVLRDVMGPLLKQNPGLHLDVVATDKLVDIVAEGFDAGDTFRSMFGLLLWIILFILCWPLALVVLLLWPLIWLISIPFRIIGITFEAVFELLRAILLLPARLLGGRRYYY